MVSADESRKRPASDEDLPPSKQPALAVGTTDESTAADAAAVKAERAKQLAERMKALTSSLAAKRAAVAGSGVSSGTAPVTEKHQPPGMGEVSSAKVTSRPTVLVDAMGREIDATGQLISPDAPLGPVKTIAANLNALHTAPRASNVTAVRKPVNPYLAHMETTQETEGVTEEESAKATEELYVDERLPVHRREVRGKRALKFVDAGHYVEVEAHLQEKEEGKIRAGYASGRKTLQRVSAPGEEKESDSEESSSEDENEIPPLPLFGSIPDLEWWDEAFLPKQLRDQRRAQHAKSKSKPLLMPVVAAHTKTNTSVDAASAPDVESTISRDQLYADLSITHCRTAQYIQHPIPVKPLIAEKAAPELPMYLTKKERKKLRKATRAEREQEKRDKQMLGLLPAAEPKFKLGNFMKILGDQAVADPSKVEMRVLAQMQQRVLAHEMRNASAKLTPAERRAKRQRKAVEDTNRGVRVAVFRVTDFSCDKWRFSVDMNAQQWLLSGMVLLTGEPNKNLVVVEGGPRGMRKFIHLMTKRIRWDIHHPSRREAAARAGKTEEDGDGRVEDGEGGFNYHINSNTEVVLEESAAMVESDEDDDEFVDTQGLASSYVDEFTPIKVDRRCDMLWEGEIPRRMFSGFKFQEVKSATAARNVMEQKNAAHYWDMVNNADTAVMSAQSFDLF